MDRRNFLAQSIVAGGTVALGSVTQTETKSEEKKSKL